MRHGAAARFAGGSGGSQGLSRGAAAGGVLGYPTEAEIGLLANDSGTLYRIENLRPL